MVARKSIIKKDDKPIIESKPGRKAPKGPKFDALPPAIVEGKFIVPVGGEIVVARGGNTKSNNIICVVKEVGDDFVNAWDETNERWYPFKVSDVAAAGVTVKRLDQ